MYFIEVYYLLCYSFVCVCVGSVELLDVSSKLQGLKFIPGFNRWKIANKELELFEKFEDVPEKNLTHIRPHMFPPSDEKVKDLHLEKW